MAVIAQRMSFVPERKISQRSGTVRIVCKHLTTTRRSHLIKLGGLSVANALARLEHVPSAVVLAVVAVADLTRGQEFGSLCGIV